VVLAAALLAAVLAAALGGLSVQLQVFHITALAALLLL
jgi:hypothetical protein